MEEFFNKAYYEYRNLSEDKIDELIHSKYKDKFERYDSLNYRSMIIVEDIDKNKLENNDFSI